MAVQCAGTAFDCVFNDAKKETRSWTENRGRILCSSNATWKPRIWFLPGRKSQPKIDRAYIVFVKSLYECFSSHLTYSYMYLPESQVSIFLQNTAHTASIESSQWRWQIWRVPFVSEHSPFLWWIAGLSVGQLDCWKVQLWMNSGLCNVYIFQSGWWLYN